MIGWLGDAYPWIKAVHVIFVIFWMAGMFMLPRYLVYHQEAGVGTPEAERWIERERKLRKIVQRREKLQAAEILVIATRGRCSPIGRASAGATAIARGCCAPSCGTSYGRRWAARDRA